MMKKEPKCSVCPDDVKSIPKNLKKYQVGTPTYSGGMLPMATVSSPMSESPIARNLRVKKALQEGRDVNTAKTANERGFENTVKELSGAGSVERIYNNPKKTVVGTAKALANIAALPVGVGQGLSEVVKGKEFNMGNNPLTGGKYSEGFDEALDVATVLPAMGLVGKGLSASKKLNAARGLIGKGIQTSKESGLLSNAYKINPRAFKLNPESYYRGIGKEGINDIIESGIIRSKKQHAYPEPYFSKGIVGDKYAKGYFAELTNEPMKGVGSFADGDLIQTPINTVSVGNPNLKLYEKNWLKGYKEVPIPGSSNAYMSVPDDLSTINFGYKPPLTIIEKGKTMFMSSSNRQKFLADKTVDDAFEYADRVMKDPEYAKRFKDVKSMTPSNAADEQDVLNYIREQVESGKMTSQDFSKEQIAKMSDEEIKNNFANAYRYNTSNVAYYDADKLPVYKNRTSQTPQQTSVQHLKKNIRINPFSEKKTGLYDPGKFASTQNTSSEVVEVGSKNLGDLFNVTVHEILGHGKTFGNVSLTQKEKELLQSVFKSNNSASSYIKMPTETMARIDEIRSTLNKDNPFKTITEDDLLKFEKMVNTNKNIPGANWGEKGSSMLQFIQNMDKKELAKVMNKMYGTAGTAVGAETLRQSKLDGKVNLPKYQLGTVFVNSAQDPRNLAFIDSTRAGQQSLAGLMNDIRVGDIPATMTNGQPIRRVEDLARANPNLMRIGAGRASGVNMRANLSNGDPNGLDANMPLSGARNKPVVTLDGPAFMSNDYYRMPRQQVVVGEDPALKLDKKNYLSIPVRSPNAATLKELDEPLKVREIPREKPAMVDQNFSSAELLRILKKPSGYTNKGDGKGNLPKFQLGSPMPTKQQYQDSIQTNYQSHLEKTGGASPLPPGVNLGMNCINGVCNFIKGTNAHKFGGKGYTGNATFNDEREKNGYYEADWRTTGFEVGDVVQYARTKDNAERIDGMKITPKNAKELYPQHAKVILNTRVDDRGRKMYTIGHNGGDIKFTTSEITEEELMKHGIEGYGTYNGLIVNRYDPEKVKESKAALLARQAVFQGNNEHASKYNTPPNFIYKGAKGAKSEQNMVGYFKKNYQALGKQSNMSPETLHKAFTNIVGIGHQESDLGGNTEVKMPQFLMDEARTLRDNFSTEDDWKKDYWKSNADGVQSKYKSEAEFKKALASRSPISPEVSKYLYLNSPRSKGTFKQKELSERGRFFDSNLDSEEKQFVSAMQLYMDNYDVVKKKYPGKTDDEYLDLATLMHNAPSKALTPEYVEYYQKNNKIDYVNKVKAQRGELVIGETFKPSGTNLIGAKDSTLANATPVPRIATPTKLSPKEVETLKAFMSKK